MDTVFRSYRFHSSISWILSALFYNPYTAWEHWPYAREIITLIFEIGGLDCRVSTKEYTKRVQGIYMYI